jgi:hypothetical protein
MPHSYFHNTSTVAILTRAGAVSSGANRSYDNGETAWAYRAFSGALYGSGKDTGKPAAAGRSKLHPGSIVTFEWDGPRGELWVSVDEVVQNSGKPCFTGIRGLLSLFPAVFAYGPDAVATLVQCEELPLHAPHPLLALRAAATAAASPVAVAAGKAKPGTPLSVAADAAGIPTFDVAESSTRAELWWSEDARTVKPRVRDPTLAVVAACFSAGLAVWEFSLDKDAWKDEAACFGFTVKPIVSRSYNDGRQPMVIRAFSGALYGRGAVGGVRGKVHSGSVVTFRANLGPGSGASAAGGVGAGAGAGAGGGAPGASAASGAAAAASATLAAASAASADQGPPVGCIEVLIDGVSQGVCWEGYAGLEIWPCAAFYGPTATVSLLRCEAVRSFADPPTSTRALPSSAASPAVGSGAVASPVAEATVPAGPPVTWDVEASLPAPEAFSLDSSKRSITSRLGGRALAVAGTGFSKRCVVEFRLTKGAGLQPVCGLSL